MFKEKLDNLLYTSLLEIGFTEPKNIQLKSISKINGGADLIGVGPIGSGKSTTLLISTIQKLKQAFEDAPRALILVPDEASLLLMQERFLLLAKNTDLRLVALSEKGKLDKQNDAIYFGTDVVIGTPKRLIDIYYKKNFNLNKLKLFIIDDAEMMVKNGFQAPIDRLAHSLPKCQHLVFTNTLTEKVERLIEKFIIAPLIVEVTE